MFNRQKKCKDFTVVIRSIGERTEQTCLALLQQQIPKNNIYLVNKTPFYKALKASYETGIKAGRPWTMVIDSDVLIRPGLISDLQECANYALKSVFVIQTEMLDKFFGGVRVGGVKLYRTELLSDALKLIPETEVRPEAHVIKKMHKQGCYVDITNIVCGMHDFEQSYADIFRKGFAHGIKHAVLAGVIMPYWQRSQKVDKDFEVLIAGYDIGSQHKGELKLDRDEVLIEYKRFAAKTRLLEKSASYGQQLRASDIAKFMSNFSSPKEYKQVLKEIKKMGKPEIPIDAK